MNTKVIKQETNISISSNGIAAYDCDICEKHYKTKAGLERHYKTHMAKCKPNPYTTQSILKHLENKPKKMTKRRANNTTIAKNNNIVADIQLKKSTIRDMLHESENKKTIDSVIEEVTVSLDSQKPQVTTVNESNGVDDKSTGDDSSVSKSSMILSISSSSSSSSASSTSEQTETDDFNLMMLFDPANSVTEAVSNEQHEFISANRAKADSIAGSSDTATSCETDSNTSESAVVPSSKSDDQEDKEAIEYKQVEGITDETAVNKEDGSEAIGISRKRKRDDDDSLNIANEASNDVNSSVIEKPSVKKNKLSSENGTSYYNKCTIL